MDSLYGGKPGISFVLKANYPSEKDMINAFKKGNNYTDVWYGEYVLIDTTNKNNKENGRIYRRGLDFQNDMGGAEYVGQIVGPSSGTPYFEIGTLDHVINHSKEKADDELVYKKYPIGWQNKSGNGYVDAAKDKEGHYQVTDDGKYVIASGSDQTTTAAATYKFNTGNQGLVAGKTVSSTGQNQWVDDVVYTWVNIKDDTRDSENSWFYVGFQFPYTVIDYTTEVVSPYKNGEYSDTSAAIRIDENPNADNIDPKKMYQHPFWERWQINLPKGIKGDVLRNFRITDLAAEGEKIIYLPQAISTKWDTTTRQYKTTADDALYYYNPTPPDGKPKCIDDAKHPGKHNEIVTPLENRKILVLDYVVYDQKENGQLYTLYIGDYNMIESIHIDGDSEGDIGDGTVRVKMTHDNDYVYEQCIKWIRDADLSVGNGSNGGHFVITWNHWDEKDEQSKPIWLTTDFYLSWIKNLEIEAEDGSLIYTFAGREEDMDPDFLSREHTAPLTDADGSPIPGMYKVSKILDWIKRVIIDDDGTIHYIHTTDSADEEGNFVGALDGVSNDEYVEKYIKWIVDAHINQTGEIVLNLNTGESITLKTTDEDSDFQLKYITDVKLDTEIEADKHIQIEYNGSGEYEPIGDPINYIYDAQVRRQDWHLLVLYSDPEHRKPHGELTPIEPNYDGQLNYQDEHGYKWVEFVELDNGEITGTGIYWRDLGSIKDQRGLLVGLNVTKAEIEANADGDALVYLNEKYPNGLTVEDNELYGDQIAEKIVTVGEDGDDKEFYAYDYDKREWYYLGALASAIDARLANVANLSESQYQKLKQSIDTDGLLFNAVYVNYIADNDLFPRYWGNEEDSTMFDIWTPPATEWEHM